MKQHIHTASAGLLRITQQTRRALGRLGGRLNLFWRTFFYLAVLLGGSLLVWQHLFWWLELEPRAVQNARQIATLVNLTRAGLEHADAIARISLVKTLADQEGLYIAPREPGDTHQPYNDDALSQRISRELRQQLGTDTEVARSVNGHEALWVGFRMGDDRYWLLLDPQRASLLEGRTLLVWLAAATSLSLLGAGVIAGLINLPLQRLKQAISRVYAGELEQVNLDEAAPTAEVRAVNQGFNRMVQQLAQIEHDRRLMLAGISHDLRTPLARLRLEAEMSVPDDQARTDMVADIEQANAIIGQFMDYARSSDSSAALATAPTTALLPVLHQAASGYQHLNDVVLTVAWTTDTADSAGTADPIPTSPHTHEPSTALLSCRADPVDVLRWVNNLLENARRYGQSPPTPPPSTLPRCAHVHLRAWVQGPYCAVQVADNGPGVDADTLTHLTRPFFRADTARSQSVGAGLGLAVVEKMLTRIGGRLELQSPGPLADLPEHRGLCATLWLPREIMK